MLNAWRYCGKFQGICGGALWRATFLSPLQKGGEKSPGMDCSFVPCNERVELFLQAYEFFLEVFFLSVNLGGGVIFTVENEEA
jgi:hypothetical protein